MTELMIAPTTTLAPTDRYPLDKHPALVYLASVSESSRRPIRQSLNTIAAIVGVERTDNDSGQEITFMFCQWGALRFEHTQAIRTKLAECGSAATANRHLSALRGVLKDAWRLSYMSGEDFQRAIDLKPVKGAKVAQAETGRHLSNGEIAALMTACDQSAAGIRDAAVLAIGYGCGLRRSELAGLDLADYDDSAGSLHIRNGKGNKDRMVYLASGGPERVREWLAVRGDAPGPLFYSIRRGDHMENKGLTDQAIYNILANRSKVAGVKQFSPHDLRRTFAGDQLDAGSDISTVQKMMGHASSDTTAGYDRRDGRTRKKAAGLLHIPLRGQLL